MLRNPGLCCGIPLGFKEKPLFQNLICARVQIWNFCRLEGSAIASLMSEFTRVLDQVQQGKEKAAEELLPLVYEELRKLAAHKMAGEAPGQTLQPTALVHEAWLRLTGAESKTWDSRGHFFATAAEAMRRILIERARAKSRLRRGGRGERIPLDRVTLASDDPPETVLAINDALERLTARDPFKAWIRRPRFGRQPAARNYSRSKGPALL